MDERYLCRAKRLDNGEWIEGYLFCSWDDYYILWGMTNGVPDMAKVDSNTICRRIGIKDKNGDMIRENDIVEIDTAECFEERYAVKWSEEDARFCLESETVAMDFDCVCGRECEITGNVFDNPEMSY